jgi:peptidoglycan hydrolase-like protein with peptidoglycan-binding domain
MVFVTKQIELNTQVLLPPQVSPKPDPNSPDIFPRNLSRNDTGPDVFLLQRLLNNFGFVLTKQGFGSPGNETNFFGPRTQKALSAFQRFFLPSVTGRFDDATRSLVNSWMR